jgi:hypothetical protein
MTDPTVNPYQRNVGTIRDVLVVIVAIALTLWTLLDDTLPAWLARLGVAGAITAGFAIALHALIRLSRRP